MTNRINESLFKPGDWARRQLLKQMLLEHGLLQILEDIEEICDDFSTEIRSKQPDLAERWYEAAGSLRYALRTIDFSGAEGRE